MKGAVVRIFDTTLRDGSQAENISFSVEDKLHIARRLDDFGIHYIEGGWPGSNPKDFLFFQRVRKESFRNARIVAFGSTKRAGNSVDKDPNLRALMDAGTPAVSIFGKSWMLHVRKALRVKPAENLQMIRDSVGYMKSKGKEVIYDAEHFFDGYKDDPDYALQTLQAAQEAGSDVIVLCDTNGGSLPSEVGPIVAAVREKIQTPLGIHAHNDSDMAVANSVTAVEHGCVHVQGTVNGYGERCGNANLCSVIPILQLKRKYRCVDDTRLKTLTALSHYVAELANLSHPNVMPFVGKSAFAHKGGIHVSAVMREASCYEHLPPENVGNRRRVLVSDLSGRSNIMYKAEELGVDLESDREKIPEIVQQLKELEHQGYQYEAAEGSLELVIKKMKKADRNYFALKGFRILMEKDESGDMRSEATIRVQVNDMLEHTAAEGVGPVNALDNALRKALIAFYPEIDEMKLSDYKVRVINAKAATSAKVRVLIESTAGKGIWGTVGVSENIIEASWQALADSISYYLLKKRNHSQTLEE